MSWIPGFDFEKVLFSEDHHPSSSSSEFDYLIFWLETEALVTDQDFESDYLSYVQKFTKRKPEVAKKSSDSKNWWGNLDNIELSQKLNSKIFSFQMAQKYHFTPEQSRLVSSEQELLETLKQNQDVEKWVLKDPFLYSGLGNQVFEGKRRPKIEEGKTYILEPWLNRTIDIGITFLKDENFDSYFGVLNLNDVMGRFKGAIMQPKLPEVEELAQELSPVVDEIKKMNPNDNLQFDNFYYLKDGHRSLYPLVELNCRKTMGWVCWKLWKKYADNKIGVLLLINNKDLKLKTLQSSLLKNFDYDESEKKGFIFLSPEGRVFQTIFLVEANIKQAQNKIVELWKEIAKTSKSLPLEFMIYF